MDHLLISEINSYVVCVGVSKSLVRPQNLYNSSFVERLALFLKMCFFAMSVHSNLVLLFCLDPFIKNFWLD